MHRGLARVKEHHLKAAIEEYTMRKNISMNILVGICQSSFLSVNPSIFHLLRAFFYSERCSVVYIRKNNSILPYVYL